MSVYLHVRFSASNESSENCTTNMCTMYMRRLCTYPRENSWKNLSLVARSTKRNSARQIFCEFVLNIISTINSIIHQFPMCIKWFVSEHKSRLQLNGKHVFFGFLPSPSVFLGAVFVLQVAIMARRPHKHFWQVARMARCICRSYEEPAIDICWQFVYCH